MLPPAGDPIVLVEDENADRRLHRRWWPYRPTFYRSGTAALAAAIAAARELRPGRVEVVLPGYGCPALVSATLYAGAQPVLIDLEPERPWLAARALAQAVGPATAAVVAVNFLGIPERLAAVAEIAHRAGALLIEDSAQGYPPAGTAGAGADFAVLSFGRGKPISLLGGGAALARTAELAAALPPPQPAHGSRWRIRATVQAYNLLRRPRLYRLVQMLPLGLGETCYQPLAGIDGMDAVRRQALGAAVDGYRRDGGAAQQLLRRRLAEQDGVLDLAAACAPAQRLLRYPLLAPTAAARDRMLCVLGGAGLGASSMYGSVLPDVRGVPAGPVHDRLAAARDFAARLLTLPVHQGVKAAHVERMCALIEAVLRDGEYGLGDCQTEKTG